MNGAIRLKEKCTLPFQGGRKEWYISARFRRRRGSWLLTTGLLVAFLLYTLSRSVLSRWRRYSKVLIAKAHNF